MRPREEAASRRSQKNLASSVLLFFLLLLASRIHAQPASDVKESLAQAQALQDQGDLAGAVRVLQSIYDVTPQPLLLYKIGGLLVEQGQGQQALDFLQRYLEKEPTLSPEDKKDVEELMDRARALLKAEIEVAGPSGSWFQVDGGQRQMLRDKAIRVQVRPGKHQVSLPGETREVAVVAGKVTTVVLPALRPAPSEAPRRPVWRLVVGGLGLSGGLAMIGFGIPALSIDNQCNPPAPDNNCPRLYDTQSLGLGLAITGAAVAVGGVVLLALPPRKRTAGPAAMGRGVASGMLHGPSVSWAASAESRP